MKTTVFAAVVAAALLNAQGALAYGHNGPTPSDLYAASNAENGWGMTTSPRRLAHDWPSRRQGRWIGRARANPVWARGGLAGAAPRPYRVASLSPVGAPTQPLAGSPAPASFGGQAAAFDGGGVVAEASRWVGSGNFTGMPGPWCADAINVWLRRSGHRPLNGRMASAALVYGPRLGGPEVGALAVLGGRRGWASHVGVVSGIEPDGSIRMISGNWGHRVAVAVIPRRSVAAFVAVR